MLLASIVAAQTPGTPAAATPIDGTAAARADDLEILVAPVALYPDPLLALVLQAATLPLEIVEADRFLERRATDPTLTPKPSWDSSVVGLLNYPTVLSRMSRELDWTQALGDAVLDRLTDVQAAVQQVRSEVQAAGALGSDDKQIVSIDNDVIRIEPAQRDVIYVPIYDPETISAAPAAPVEAPAAQAGAPPTAQSAPPAYPPPVYPAYPAPVMYSEPYPSYWGTGAVFLGGAVMGGLLGYALADDDHDHGDFDGASFTRGSGNTINIDRSRTEQAQAALRSNSAERRANRSGGAQTRPARAGGQPDARRPSAPARAQSGQPASGLGDVKPRREAQLESQRGAQSRSAARRGTPSASTRAVPSAGGRVAGGASPAASRQSAPGRSSGGGSAFSGVGGGDRSAKAAQRGATSRGGGGRGGGRRG
jgi:hypothetical protein